MPVPGPGVGVVAEVGLVREMVGGLLAAAAAAA